DGISVLYISHRLKEVEMIADRVMVLRDGRNAGELNKDQITHEGMVRLMVGRELKQFFQRSRSSATESGGLEVRGLPWRPRQPAIDRATRPGGRVGMAGWIGAGGTDRAETLFGIRPMVSGELRLSGQTLRIRRPQQAIAAGIYLVPEDRRSQGLLLAQ